MKVSDLLTLDVVDLVPGGQALARHEGRVIFVDRGLPGDRIRARVTRVKPRFAEARMEALDVASGDRVPPPCPHVAHCGGCRFQELAYDRQLAIKEQQVRGTLEHVAGLADPPVAPIVAAPEAFGYRNKMEFSFHPGTDGVLHLGLHARGTFDRVFDLQDCLLPSRLTVEIVRATRAFAIAQGWSAWHPRAQTGLARHLVVRHLPHSGQCAVHLVATREELPGLADWSRAIAALSPEVRTITLLVNRSRAQVATGESEHVLHGDGRLTEALLGLEFEVTSSAFLQTNSRQAEVLYRLALEAGDPDPGGQVLDLYCGAGTLTLLFARVAGAVVGVEAVEPAIEAARRNATRNRIGNASFVAGDARRVMREWARGERPGAPRPDLVVVDPPRAGLHPRVVARIIELGPRRIVYVSCNPATLARDLQLFAAGGFQVTGVTPVDMFPQTPHVECVARLDRRAGSDTA